MELSPAVIEWCKYEALGQCLVQWGKDDEKELPYEEVIELLESVEETISLYNDHGIMVWTTYENESGTWLADQIESLYKSYLDCAKFAKEN